MIIHSGMNERVRYMESFAKKLAEMQKEVSVAEFFEKNKHLLGFENPTKSLLTCVREAVDNSLDACEEARILPDIYIEITPLDENKEVFKLVVEDNGPGIVKEKVPLVFGKLLFGSKFHRLKQSRGQQGIGISGAVLYSQLTTGKPAKVYSRIGDGKVYVFEIRIDTVKNEPEVLNKLVLEGQGHGVRIELELRGRYNKGRQSVMEYVREVAMMNPFAQIVFVDPEGKEHVFERKVSSLPPEPKEMKPHPHGIEFGMFLRMLKQTKARTLSSFLTSEFSRVGNDTAKNVCQLSGIDPSSKPASLSREQAEELWDVLQQIKLASPPTNCLSPVGSEAIEKSLKKELNPEFVVATTRRPAVYRGNPFLVEAGIAYGGDIPADGLVRIYRYANRMPLLYEQSACAITKAIAEVDWRRYGLNQPNGSLPYGPVAIAVHFASVWVPYTSEGKEAIASYPEITREVKLALQEAGRKLGAYLSAKRREQMRERKINIFLRYSPEVITAIKGLTGVDENTIGEAVKNLLVRRGLYARDDAEVVADDVVEIAEEELEGNEGSSRQDSGGEHEKKRDESLSRWVVE